MTTPLIQQLYEQSTQKWRWLLLGLILVLLATFALNISLGSVHIPVSALVKFFTTGSTENTGWDVILLNFRMPKALTAIFVGSALGISGLQMQTLFRNPLAGPFVLGISSGAGLGVALVIFIGFAFGGLLELSGIGRSWLLVCAAGTGAFSVLLIVSLAANRLRDSVSLLLIGLMFGAAAGALVSILQFFSQAENIQAYVIWSFGSLGSLSWAELQVFVPILTLGLLMSLLLSKPLNALLLGENYARSLGMNLQRVRMLIILNTAILAGTVTAFCGPIAFFGIAMPHITRMLFNTSDHLRLTPLLIFTSGILMLLFDLIAQLPGSEATLPINAVTALFGAPFVIYLLVRKKNLHYRA